MKLARYEQETILLFNEKERTASVFTYNAGLQKHLKELCESHFGQVRQIDDNGFGGLTFKVPKKWIKVVPPRVLSEAQRQVLEEMNRKNRECRKTDHQ